MKMKSAWAKVATVAAMAWCGAAWEADGEMRYGTTTLDGYTFSYIADTRVVNGQTNEYATVRKITPLPSGNYAIPSQLDGVPVVILSEDDLRNPCFAGAGVTDIHMPPTLEIISGRVFSHCTQLTNVVFPASLGSIGACAFSNCTALTEIHLPTSGLTNINIGYSAFANSGLESVVIPNAVTVMGTGVFAGCTNLTSAVLPSGMTAIPVGTFKGCTNLVDFSLPAGVVSIGNQAFWETGLPFLELPADMAKLGDGAFVRSALREMIIPGGVAEVPSGLLSGSTALTNLVLQEGVKNIGNASCYMCSQLASISLPDTLTNIDAQAFWGTNLRKLVIPYSVTNIGQRAFYGCTALTNVTLGSGLRDTGWGVFYRCTSLASITIPDNVTNIADSAFRDCSNLTSVVIGTGVESIGGTAFYNCSSLESVSIPDSVTHIGDQAFMHCTSLSDLTIGDGLTEIGPSVFYYCTNLTSVTIGNGVTNIGAGAFYACYSLSRVKIPDNVTAIGTNAFVASGLKTLVVPASWEGTDKLDGVWLPSGCKVVYGSGESEATTRTPVAVPHEWLMARAPHILAAAGGDYEAAAMAMASNRVNKVWECYVAGLEPEDAESVFSMTANVRDGEVELGWTPDLGAERKYVVKGSEKLKSWGETNEASRFFRVNVGMPE